MSVSMKRIEIACLLAGVLLITLGVAFVFWPAALIVGGVALVVAALDIGR